MKSKKLTIYLAGAITHHETEALGWRDDFKNSYSNRFNIISPSDKWARMEHLRGSDRWPAAVVAGERRDIHNSNAVIAKIRPLSAGTSIGLVYAFLSGKTVVLYDELAQSQRSEDRLSPVVLFHQHAIFDDLNDCIAFIEKRHSRRTVSELQSAQDETVPWDEDILIREIQGMISRLAASQPQQFDYLEGLDSEILADAVIMQLEDDLEAGKIALNQVSSDQLRRITESIFMGHAYRDEMDNLAKHYIRYREGIKKRRSEQDQRDTEAARYKTYLHDIKGKIGNIVREAEYILEEEDLDRNKNEIVDSAETIIRNSQMILELGEAKRKEIENPESTGKLHIQSAIKEWIDGELRKFGDVHFDHENVSEDLLVEIDRAMFLSWLQVFMDNARQHGGDHVDHMKVVITASLNSSNEACIDFWNSGNQIDHAKAEALFDESATVKSKEKSELLGHEQRSQSSGFVNWGHGLYGISLQVSKMGGSITCTPCRYQLDENSIGSVIPSDVGSPRFRIDLPGIASSNVVKSKVLVADDVDEDRRSFIKCLAGHYEIIACSSIDEALERATENTDLYGAVLDLNFNDYKGRDGVWLCENLKRIKPSLIIAMASGKTSWSTPETSWQQRAYNAGAAKAFAKETYKRKELLGVFQ